MQEIPVDEFLGDKETLETSSTTRRDFLKYVGFSTAAASLAACEGPVSKIDPLCSTTRSNYSWRCKLLCKYYCKWIMILLSVLVKTREGRPIKIENNAFSCNLMEMALMQEFNASVLDLYDSSKSWMDHKKNGESIVLGLSLNTEVMDKLNALNSAVATGKEIVLINTNIC